MAAADTISTDVNTYVNILRSNEYFDTSVLFDEWAEYTDDQKARGLMHATRILETLDYLGSPADYNQPLKFPRILPLNRTTYEIEGSGGTPVDIIYATCEFALTLLNEKPFGRENNIKSQSFGKTKIVYDVSQRSDIIPDHINELLWGWLQPRTFQLA